MIQDITTDAEGKPLIYWNDPLVRGPEINIPLTKEHIEEYMLCKNNPVYFMENYCKINDPDKGFTLVKLYDWQKMLINQLAKERFNILLLPRQCISFWTKIDVRNIKTGKIMKVSIGRLYIEQQISKKIYQFLSKFL